MIAKAGSYPVTPRVPMGNGKPGGTIETIFTDEMLGHQGDVFAKVTVLPGAAIPRHRHVGEYEVYFIMSGSGIYSDNDDIERVGPGDSTYCAEGGFHGLVNDGQENIEILALICKWPTNSAR